MKVLSISKSQKTKRLKLSFSDTIFYYVLPFFLLIVPVYSAYTLCEIYFFHSYTGKLSSTDTDILQTGFASLIAAIVSFVILRRGLRFKDIKVETSIEDYTEAIQRTAKELEWEIEHCNSHSTRAYSNSDFGIQMITIIKNKNILYINSISSPEDGSNGLSLGQNRKNINTFIRNLHDVINGKPAPILIDEDLNHKEWSFKSTIIRILIYAFGLFLIGFSFLNLIPAGEITASFFLIMISVLYIYFDLKILLTRKKENQ